MNLQLRHILGLTTRSFAVTAILLIAVVVRVEAAAPPIESTGFEAADEWVAGFTFPRRPNGTGPRTAAARSPDPRRSGA